MNLKDDNALPIEWNTDEIVRRRDRYYAATQRAFVKYQAPLILKRGSGQSLWDEKGNKLIDLLCMNLCVSVGHCQPDVLMAMQEGIKRPRNLRQMKRHLSLNVREYTHSAFQVWQRSKTYFAWCRLSAYQWKT